jgi:hypothetical protein
LYIFYFCIIIEIYIAFRFITESKNVKIGFVETILGNKQSKKEKKSKELSNGSLEEKPNNIEKQEIETEEESNPTIEETEEE